MYRLGTSPICQEMTCPHCDKDVVFMNDQFNEMMTAAWNKREASPGIQCHHCSKTYYLSAGDNLSPFLVSQPGWEMEQELDRQRSLYRFWPQDRVEVECQDCHYKFWLSKDTADRMGKEYLPFNCPYCYEPCLLPGSPPKPKEGWGYGFGFLHVHACPRCKFLTHKHIPIRVMTGGTGETQCEKCSMIYETPSQEYLHCKYDPSYAEYLRKKAEETQKYWREYNKALLAKKTIMASVMCGLIAMINFWLWYDLPANPSGAPGAWTRTDGLDAFMIAWPQMAIAIFFVFVLPPFFRRVNGDTVSFDT